MIKARTLAGGTRDRWRRRRARSAGVPILAAAALGVAAPAALAAPAHGVVRAGHAAGGNLYGVGPITDVSKCPGGNAEVEEATAPPDFVYVAWIGCGGEGFARSTDGGKTFSAPITLPDSGSSDDPAMAVASNGTVYVSYLRYHDNHGYPVVARSSDHGRTFQAASLIPAKKDNWGDRDFIAAGPNGTVYVTWDYGPSQAAVKIICSPVGSCAYSAVDATAVVQKSTDFGKTWGPITTMQPGFPAGGGYDASLQVEPSGRVDALIWGHHLNPSTFAVHPGHELFTSSPDGTTWPSQLATVDSQAGSIAIPTWWIDGDLGMDAAGNLYATWDTQASGGADIGWLAFSTDHGKTWSAPIRVTRDQDKAMHNVEVVGAGPGAADVAWQSSNSPLGYATFLRPFSITKGWLAPAIQVSKQYGNKLIWPGDTFGISILPNTGTNAPERVSMTWGSAIQGHQNSEIYAAVATLPHRFYTGG